MVFVEYLTRLKQHHHFSHSLILETARCCDYKQLARTYLKTLVCTNAVPFCDECLECNRINHDNYIDFIYLDNNLEAVLKEDAIAIQAKFLRQASEAAGVKLYVVKNLEKANKFVLNSLLKFIEEPPTNTYALFITRNSQSILNTIKSRSQTILIQDHTIFDQSGGNIPQPILENVFADYAEFITCQSECDLDNVYQLANNILHMKNVESQIKYANQIRELNKLEFTLFFQFLNELVNPKQRIAIDELTNNIKLNINKRCMIQKLFDILTTNR